MRQASKRHRPWRCNRSRTPVYRTIGSEASGLNPVVSRFGCAAKATSGATAGRSSRCGRTLRSAWARGLRVRGRIESQSCGSQRSLDQAGPQSGQERVPRLFWKGGAPVWRIRPKGVSGVFEPLLTFVCRGVSRDDGGVPPGTWRCGRAAPVTSGHAGPSRCGSACRVWLWRCNEMVNW